MKRLTVRILAYVAVLLWLTFLLSLTYLVPVQAKPINWKIAGPEGGPVNCFASPDATGALIFAGCYGGVYKSTDAGEHWQYLPKSPPMVSFLAINPLNPNILYAGWTNGVSKSSDGGRTWQLTLNSGYDSSVYIPLYSGRPPTGLAVDPVNPQNVYATFASAFQQEGGPMHGCFCHSSDGGQTWTETNPPVYGATTYDTTTTIFGLAVDPFQSGIIYVSFSDDKLRSQDYGQTFWRVYSGSGQVQRQGYSLYAEPTTPNVLYSYGNNLFRSNDGGYNWFNTSGPTGMAVISHRDLGWAVLAASGEGVAKGYSPFTNPWTSFSSGLGNGLVPLSTVLALHPHVVPDIASGAFAGMASGVYRTATMDFNGDWRPKNKGLTNVVVTCLAVAPDSQHTIYAGIKGGGIFKSTDRGQSWQAINQGLALTEAQLASGTTLQINALAVEWLNYFKIYAATNIGLFRSVDGGANWLPTSFTDAFSVITDPQVQGAVYAVAVNGSGTLGNWRSTDAGQTWGALAANSSGSILVAGPSSFPIYSVGGANVKRLNGVGQNWEDISGAGNTLALDPRLPTTLYVGTGMGVYKSIDGGAHWTTLNSGSPPFNFTPQRQVTAIAVDPTNSDVYVGLQNGGYNDKEDGFMPAGGIWKSCDGGQTWTDLGLSYRGVNVLALDPAKKAIYCGLENAGVAVAAPGGAGIPAIMDLLLLDH